MVQAAGRLLLEGRKYDMIHGHDWLVIMAARTLKHQLRVPLMMTIHATEHGRNHGIYTGLQRYINDLEWLSCFEAWRVIVCSEYMNREIQYLFQVPRDKIDIVENGVNSAEFAANLPTQFRENYAHPAEKVVFFVGRLVQEKGVQVLIDAIPEVLVQYPQTKFVIAGKGPKEGDLKHQAQIMGIADRCYFTGFISDEVRNNLYQVCDLAVFPSLYEPFGIVALEAMAARVPVLVTNVGGLGEIVEDGVDGFRVHPGSPHELAQGILRALNNPDISEDVREAGYKKAKEQYNWPGIAQKTLDIYQRVYQEYLDSPWGQEYMEPPHMDVTDSKDNWVHYRYQS
jgi:glycogen(starch) synthase